MKIRRRVAGGELLESRRHLAVTAAIDGRTLVVTGDAGENQVGLAYNFVVDAGGKMTGAFSRFDVVNLDGPAYDVIRSFDAADFDSVHADFGDDSDNCFVLGTFVDLDGRAKTFSGPSTSNASPPCRSRSTAARATTT